MKHLRSILILLALISPAHALDVVFPVGSRVGLAPPPGMKPSHSFLGFEDVTNKVAVIVAALPRDAYGELQRSTAADELKKRGLIVETREDQTLPAGPAFLVVARQEVDNLKLHKWIFAVAASDLTALVTIQVPDEAANAYPETAVRGALSTLKVRDTIPDEEQLSLLPFHVGELAQFRIGGVIPGRAIMLTDAPKDEPAHDIDTHIVVAIAPGGPGIGGDRDIFARDVFATIPNLKDIHINSAEPLRIGGQQGHQVMATAKDVRSGTDINIVQWLRFGGGAYLHLIGVAPSKSWIPAYTRFRQVRDGIELK
jgi:hypothetical protein